MKKGAESIIEKAKKSFTADNKKNKPKRLSKRVNESYVVSQSNFTPKSFSVSNAPLKAHEELFQGYIDSLNKVSAKLDTSDRSLANANHSEFRSLKIDENYNANAAFMHSLYFENIGSPDSSIAIDSIPYLRLSRDWGSFDAWQQDFVACAMSARSGWVMTVYSLFLQRYMNVVVDLQNGHMPLGAIPVIAIDMWEHSYFKDYLKDKKKYVFAAMQELNWDVIEKRIKRADKAAKVYGGE